MAVKVTPEEYAEKQAARLKGALEDMRRGIERVSQAPGQNSAAKKQKWVAKLAEKTVQDRWANNVGKVTLEDWKRSMVDKGIGRVASGIDAAHAKQVEFAQKLFAHQNSLLQSLDKMPDLTLEDSINRASAWIRGMSQFKR